ncbi:HTH domain-containing protein [Lysinibacillus sphaericus]|uniref:Helix-turn-helix domain-containing protein n=1 Tax=Lysinibacillus sphaericus TaxID=1421 RepID=A0A2S0K4U8_LYSSH|nr:HTH domain-containing protein [Lysinibacillus sphaericus]AVK98395.1 helix-turn-helix domain-containing protein [Lysinibacillus sphaericus]MED4543913.1 HTH domain-containing protein [Lysinibacillus sphaericus]TKI18519.1 HTH domain-containing protein [Lysinibacillus sphaericus]SUV15638.1 transcriptional regulator [Lysinibacillus sphaericus]GEC80870.1 hypothetical protein LSP03_06130 [Lysinibacillus sphaericus]
MIRNRQMEILLHLLKVKKTTHEALARQFEVSVKTIQRDIDKLSMMGVPVTCKQGHRGGVYIEEHYKLSSSFFNDEDLQVLTFALSVYDSLSMQMHKERILKKLALISPELIYLYEQDAKDYFIVDLFDNKVDMTEAVYQRINHCLDEEYYLRVIIGEKQMDVAPISYVLKADGLYLYAFERKYVLIKIASITYSHITNIEFERNFTPYQQNHTIIFK